MGSVEGGSGLLPPGPGVGSGGWRGGADRVEVVPGGAIESERFAVASHHTGPSPPLHRGRLVVVLSGWGAELYSPAGWVGQGAGGEVLAAGVHDRCDVGDGGGHVAVAGGADLSEGRLQGWRGGGFGVAEPPVQDSGDVVGSGQGSGGRRAGEGGGAVSAGGVDDPEPGGQGGPGVTAASEMSVPSRLLRRVSFIHQ